MDSGCTENKRTRATTYNFQFEQGEENTKQGTTPAELETVRWWNEMTTVPSVVIGGITIENCRPLISAGADFLAIVGGVWDHPEGEAAAVKAFNKAFENST